MLHEQLQEYAQALAYVARTANRRGTSTGDARLVCIARVIEKYVDMFVKEVRVQVSSDDDIPAKVNVGAIYMYIREGHIELIDFANDADVRSINPEKKKDFERFVLSHVYCLLQKTI